MHHIPLMSRIEYTEAVRTLPTHKRLTYALLSTGTMVGGFLTAMLFALALALGILYLILGQILPDDVLFVAFPVAAAFMISLGFTKDPMPEATRPDDTLAAVTKQVAIRGLRSGFIIGLIFGIVWGLVIRVGSVYIAFNTFITPDFRIGEMFVFSIIIAVSVAPAFAAYRALIVAAGHYWVYRMGRSIIRPH